MSKAGLRKLYEALPKIDCQRKCQAFCGPIAMSREEWDRIVKHKGGRISFDQRDLTCPLLSADGRCTVYDLRPMICRIWGLTESMACPHGCKPEKWLTDEEAWAFVIATGVYDVGGTRSFHEGAEYVNRLPATAKRFLRRQMSVAVIPPRLDREDEPPIQFNETAVMLNMSRR